MFLLSKSANTQIVAQATLSQMITGVFGRIPLALSLELTEKFTQDIDKPKEQSLDATSPASAKSNTTSSPVVNVEITKEVLIPITLTELTDIPLELAASETITLDGESTEKMYDSSL